MRCNVTGCRIVASDGESLVDACREQAFQHDLSLRRSTAESPNALWDNGYKVCRMMRQVQHRWFW